MGDSQAALQEVARIVQGLVDEPQSEAFRVPVDWHGLGLADYPSIVKNPMDLGTVLTKIRDGEYGTAAEAMFDVRLTWENCKLYNHESSDIYQLAVEYARRWEDAVAAAPALQSAGEDVQPPTPQLKRAFCDNLFDLSSLQLGQLVELLDQQCETAIDKSTPSQLEINVDKIDPATFFLLDKFVRNNLPEGSKRKRSGKRKSSGGKGAKKTKTGSS